MDAQKMNPLYGSPQGTVPQYSDGVPQPVLSPVPTLSIPQAAVPTSMTMSTTPSRGGASASQTWQNDFEFISSEDDISSTSTVPQYGINYVITVTKMYFF